MWPCPSPPQTQKTKQKKEKRKKKRKPRKLIIENHFSVTVGVALIMTKIFIQVIAAICI
jgi:hypothetical protein